MVRKEDIDQMERLKNIMEGKKPSKNINSGRPNNVPMDYQKDPKDDMKEILKRMNRGASAEIKESNIEINQNQYKNLSQDEIVDRMISGDSTQFNPNPRPNISTINVDNQKKNIVEDDNFQIIVELYPGSKIRKLYSISNNGSLTEYQNFQMFETAQLIIESLMSNKKDVDFYIKKDREFSNLIKESLFYKSKAEKSRQINEEEAEKILISKSKGFSNNAQNIQRSMRDLIKLF